MPGIFDQQLDRCAANYAPLTPLSFIARTAYTWPDRIAVVHGPRRYTWSETYARARKLASVLARHGIARGDTVAAMLSNTPEMVEAHHQALGHVPKIGNSVEGQPFTTLGALTITGMQQ